MPNFFRILAQTVYNGYKRLDGFSLSVLLHNLDLKVTVLWFETLLDHAKTFNEVRFSVRFVPLKVAVIV